MFPTPMILPDPWFCGDVYAQLYKQAAITITHGAIVATNNDALYAPIVFPCDATLYAMRICSTNTSGNYDLGLYDAALNRLSSKGSTALASGINTHTLPEIRVIGGETYYAACAFSNNAASIIRGSLAVTGLQRSMGFGLQASAFPLPNPAAPGTPVGTSVVPIFAFGVR